MSNTAKKNYEWTLEAKQNQGNLQLRWSTTDCIRAMNGRVVIYNGDKFPQNPGKDIKAWQWTDNPDLHGVWQTDFTWGSNWYCAIIGNPNKACSNASELYIVKLITVDNEI